MGEEVKRLAGLLCTQPRHRESYVAVDPERFARLEGETSRFFVPHILGIQVVADATVAPDVVELRDKYDKVLIGFGGVSSPKAQTATERYVIEQERRLREGTASIAEMNPRWDGHGPLTATEIAVSDFAKRHGLPAPAKWVCECGASGIAATDAAAREALAIHERTHAGAGKEPEVQKPAFADIARRLYPPPKHRYVQATGVVVSSGDVAAKSAEAIRREKERRREQLREYRDTKDPGWLDPRRLADATDISLEPGAINGVGPSRWHCETCMAGGSGSTEKQAFDAERAHYATVEHDRATETMLRGNVKAALAEVETAREALYDYLKGKGRVA